MMTGALVAQNAGWLELADSVGGLPVPFQREIVLAEFEVAGTNHVNAITSKTRHLAKGDILKTVREPENMFDGKAIRIETANGVKLGYVPRKINDMPSRLIDAGKHFFFRVEGRSVIDHYVKIEGELVMKD